MAAFAVGGRLIARDESGAWSRLDEAARLCAADLGFKLDATAAADPAVREKIAARLAHVLVDYITDTPRDALGKSLLLTGELDRSVVPSAHFVLGRRRPNICSSAKRPSSATSRNCWRAAFAASCRNA